MDLRQEANLLRRVPLFSKVEPARLKLLAFTSEHLTFEDGEVVFRVGDPADCAYVVMEGKAEIVIPSDAGDLVVGKLGKNELFGELAIFNNAPRSATIRASGHLAAMRVTDEAFLKLVTENPPVALEVLRQLSDKLARSVKQFEALQTKLQKYEAGGGGHGAGS